MIHTVQKQEIHHTNQNVSRYTNHFQWCRNFIGMPCQQLDTIQKQAYICDSFNFKCNYADLKPKLKINW